MINKSLICLGVNNILSGVKREQKSEESDEEQVRVLVELHLFPYLSGEITAATSQQNEYTPLHVKLKEVLNLPKSEKFEGSIQKRVYDEYITQAVKIFIVTQCFVTKGNKKEFVSPNTNYNVMKPFYREFKRAIKIDLPDTPSKMLTDRTVKDNFLNKFKELRKEDEEMRKISPVNCQQSLFNSAGEFFPTCK
ncbi:MAG: hypothetical protein VX777_04410 [Chlamydiota bacterium]|nr:hypothetical protein [Chlamydiota bacterium]